MDRKEYLKGKNLSKVFNITEGVVSKLTDALLFSIYFGFEASIAGYGKSYKAGNKAMSDLEKTNYKSIKRSIRALKNKGLINIVETENKLPVITEAGKERLYSIIPKYDQKRVWDHRIYMVTYDLPVAKNNDRNRLREYIKTIGCGMLQESVWITPYNPKKLIEEFIEKKRMENNLIIVSSIGKDGAIGGMDTQDLISLVYGLDELNEEYSVFINWVESENPDKSLLISRFLSILKKDPQVPYDLLPNDWAGENAYELFKKARGF